ncbi:MAG: lytic transglycosylase domain-containing protein [Firmicutes bacterium]|nr:lytic transglycosylase domain-containing protein [Bacillota bacterium]
MKIRTIAPAIALIGLLVMVLACQVFADSSLSNPGMSGHDAIMSNHEANTEDARAITPSSEDDRNTVYDNPIVDSKTIKPKAVKKSTERKYPSIHVRYRVFTSNPKASGSYKYKKYSSRSGHYQTMNVDITPIIIREAKKNGISPLLLKGVIATESGFNNYAVGGGALGLCQLMPSTARNMGVNDPFNPEQNIAGGAKLLGSLMREYGSMEKALAAYNMGSGSVSRYGPVPGGAWGFISTVKRNMRW